ncbi:hypothetical protein KDX16_16090 [Burkholderia vietnamiensis]|uniref:Uncharacterized protein n=1 Tax=Burkholderia aenigmatica TaxID=2015348 RepID=A0A6P2TBA9_9BURK|nr:MULTISPECIES: hypothetical protein [Burkholderia cepacia complex]HDR9763283.1 hypothetical protein [Burkholderia cepacia ATCC 25416]MBR7917345.1 hypothetical protein [Burkholderia vietnamiensis]MBR8055250.1 hypothetical protein [Burkholderia vietnamiensis]VWC53619.1 hypothetical protein BLA13014_08231 [Burkholderia aenigmatica]HDR9795559.1 hypothetical protein [Burkholderia cepacia ATCC 25416]
MAIYLCSNAHISTLAAYAVQHQICLPHLKLDYRGAAAGTWIAGELFKANVKAVTKQYGKCEIQVPHAYLPMATLPEPVVILKLCEGYECQVEGLDDYPSLLAGKIISALRAKAIRMLPGYESAPWCISDQRFASWSDLNGAVASSALAVVH